LSSPSKRAAGNHIDRFFWVDESTLFAI
jgi:hypothetical protein